MSVHSLLLVNNALLEINHIFICIAGVDLNSLQDMGIVCSEPVRHPHQGTASSLIFFENTYLELIWVEDEATAEIYAMQSGIDFLARANWEQTNASPFGIALRQKSEQISAFNAQDSVLDPRNEFVNFAAANLTTQSEPVCFVVPNALSLTTLLDKSSATHRKLLSHEIGCRNLTNTKVAIEKVSNLTAPISMLWHESVIEVEQNAVPSLELTFDYGAQGRSLDMRSLGIPILLKY